MNKSKHLILRVSDVVGSFSPYVALAVVPLCLFWLFTAFGISDQTAAVEPLMWLCILLTVGIFLYKSCKTGWKTEDLVALILMLGFIMRIGYMLYTHMYTRAHDVGYISEESHGHIPYIWTLYTEHRLPDSNSYQFYHPPFYHIASAVSVWLTSVALPSASNDTLVETAKVVSCFASCGGLLVVKRICDELSLKRNGQLLALGIVALHPEFFLMGGRINNDALVTFFIFVIVLYTIRWYKNQSVKNTIALALTFGFGMMTKISAGTLALFTGPVMLYVWFKNRRTPEFFKIFGKGVLFAVICVPLALWYPIRNLIKFDQALNYVPMMSTEHDLYVGNYSIAQRFFSLDPGSLFDSVYPDPWEDYNIIHYLLKNSVFGEFSFEGVPDLIPILLVIVNIVLIVLSLAAMVYVLVQGRKLHPLLRFGMPYVWLVQFGSYLLFQVQYPFGCTMDFRYIPLTAVTGALMIGAAAEVMRVRHKKALRYAEGPVTALVIVFCALSIVMYCSIS